MCGIVGWFILVIEVLRFAIEVNFMTAKWIVYDASATNVKLQLVPWIIVVASF